MTVTQNCFCYISFVSFYRNRLHIGHQYVEVYQGKRADYYAAVSSVSASF